MAGVMIVLFAAVAGAETLPTTGNPAPAAAGDLVRTLALFDQVDPLTLPADQLQTLSFAVADALLSSGQPDRALAYLGQFRGSLQSPVSADVDDRLRARLQQIGSPVLTAALQAGTPLAALLQAELARRGNAPLSPSAEPAIAVLLPLSGRYAAYGLSVQQGVELARSAFSSSVPGRFEFRDSAADAATVSVMIQELAARPEVTAIVALLSGDEADPAAVAAERERVPLLLLSPREGTAGGYVFHAALSAAAQVRALVDHAVTRAGLQRFVILHPTSRYGELYAGLFQAAVEQEGGRVLARRSYAAGAVDLRPTLQALAADARRGGSAPAEALFLPDAASQAAQIIPQLGFARLDQLQLLGTSAWNDPEMVRLAGPQIEGAVFVDGFFADSPNPEVRDFVARFQQVYGTPPGVLAAQGYDTAQLLLTVLGRSKGLDREGLRLALGERLGLSGETAATLSSPQGEAARRLFLLQVQAGAVEQIN
jgi:ABC-type branched-subunit amino acid transport system substrate-binding protein